MEVERRTHNKRERDTGQAGEYSRAEKHRSHPPGALVQRPGAAKKPSHHRPLQLRDLESSKDSSIDADDRPHELVPALVDVAAPSHGRRRLLLRDLGTRRPCTKCFLQRSFELFVEIIESIERSPTSVASTRRSVAEERERGEGRKTEELSRGGRDFLEHQITRSAFVRQESAQNRSRW